MKLKEFVNILLTRTSHLTLAPSNSQAKNGK